MHAGNGQSALNCCKNSRDYRNKYDQISQSSQESEYNPASIICIEIELKETNKTQNN